MALFKVSKGLNTNLPETLTEGYCWYTYNDSKFYIDFKDENGVLSRKALNAQEAEKLTGYEVTTILNSSEVEIPTSQAVMDAINNLMPRLTTITLLADSWTGDSLLYYQTTSVSGVNVNSKLDLQPTPEQILEFNDAEISLMATNTNGVVTVYSFNGKPVDDIEMQVLITDVEVIA